MAKTQINLDHLRTEAVRPLYVVAGATDLAVEIARGYANEASERVQRVQSVDLEPKALQSRLTDTYSELAVRGEKLVTRLRTQQASQDLKAAAETTTAKAKATRTSAQKAADSTTSSAKATSTTAKKAAGATKSRAKATGTTAKKGAKATRSNAKATGTSARKTAKKATEAVADGAAKVGA